MEFGFPNLASIEKAAAPFQMGYNLWKEKPLLEGLYDYTSKSRDKFSKEFDQLVNGLSRFGNAWDIVTGNPAVDPNFFPKDKAAVMSRLVYGDLDPTRKEELMKEEGITEVPELGVIDPKTGFKTMVYKYTTPEGETAYALAFAGTEDGTDWLEANIPAVYGRSSQHPKALEAYKALDDYIKAKDKGAKIVLTGHSLGGGLAANVAQHHKLPAITFNAAGTNLTTHGIQNALDAKWDNIDSYSINTDPLTIIQNTLGLGLGLGQSGRPHTISASDVSTSVNGHSIENFLDR
jgi:hypothetical protein